MDKKYKLKFGSKINITLLVVALICIAGIICDSVFIAKSLQNELPATAYIVSLALLIALLALTPIFMFGSYYTIREKQLLICICFMRRKIDISDILSIRHDKSTGKTIAYYNTYSKGGEQLVTMCYINIADADLQQFVDTLKSENNMIIYEVFHEDEENVQN